MQLQLGHRRIRAGGFGFVGVGELARSQRTRGVSHVHVQPAVRQALLPAHGLNLRIRRVHAGGGVVPQRLERGLDRFALCLIRASLIQVFGQVLIQVSIVDDVDAEHHPGFGGVLGDRVHANLHGGVGTDIAQIALRARARGVRVKNQRLLLLLFFLFFLLRDDGSARLVLLLLDLVPDDDALTRGFVLHRGVHIAVRLVRRPFAQTPPERGLLRRPSSLSLGVHTLLALALTHAPTTPLLAQTRLLPLRRVRANRGSRVGRRDERSGLPIAASEKVRWI